MAATLQDGMNEIRDLIYASDPKRLIGVQGFKFTRDEFIFVLRDERTNVTSCSQYKFTIRTRETVLIYVVDNGGTWEYTKYDGTTLLITDPELVWLKDTIDGLIETIQLSTVEDLTLNEYSDFLTRITEGTI